MSFIKNHALAIAFAAGFSQAVVLSQSPPPHAQTSVSRNPAVVRDWENRLLDKDAKVRASAKATLVRDAQHSFPLLRRFLDPEHEDLHAVTFEIIHQIGPPAIPLLANLLQHQWESVRRSA